jgi:hypothetical protein
VLGLKLRVVYGRRFGILSCVLTFSDMIIEVDDLMPSSKAMSSSVCTREYRISPEPIRRALLVAMYGVTP